MTSPDHLQVEQVLTRIVNIVDRVDSDHRRLSRREASAIAEAFGYLRFGAFAEAENALTELPAPPQTEAEISPNYEPVLTTDLIRREVDNARRGG